MGENVHIHGPIIMKIKQAVTIIFAEIHFDENFEFLTPFMENTKAILCGLSKKPFWHMK